MSSISTKEFLQGDLKPGEYDVKYKSGGKTFYFHVVVGDNVDSSTTLNFDGYGSGISSDGKRVDKYLSNHDQNSIDIRFQYDHDGYKTKGWEDAVSNFMGEIADKKGINSDNTMLMGYSSTAAKTIGLAAEYVKETGANGSTVVVIEPVPGAKISRKDVKKLIDSDTLVVNVHSNSQHNLRTGRKKTTEGLHMLDIGLKITTKGGSKTGWMTEHILTHELFSKYGITDLSSGEMDFSKLPSKIKYKGKWYYIDYTYKERYVDENGEYTSRKIDPEAANDLIDTVKSDNDYLAGKLTSIKQLARKAKQDGVSLGDFDSTTQTPSAEPGILSSLISVSTIIFDKLRDELVTIGNIGDDFVKMDEERAREALNLNDDLQSVYSQFKEVLPDKGNSGSSTSANNQIK